MSYTFLVKDGMELDEFLTILRTCDNLILKEIIHRSKSNQIRGDYMVIVEAKR